MILDLSKIFINEERGNSRSYQVLNSRVLSKLGNTVQVICITVNLNLKLFITHLSCFIISRQIQNYCHGIFGIDFFLSFGLAPLYDITSIFSSEGYNMNNESCTVDRHQPRKFGILIKLSSRITP